MISKGQKPDYVTYETPTDCPHKKGEIRKALDFRDCMISEGFEPDVPLISEIHKAIEEPGWW
jgi:hypothetical protein